ncbi:HNH endonuclease [Methylibium sp.]|jgi:5-methylcytosine-specific restriction protein A|uniref:HNH endonuclease n=1 Tax=Methylibium sp. TaxID=2067992 RepID=UPI003D104BD2
MAVTKGHGNPDWTRDEIILALDLYFQCHGIVPSPNDPQVISLSGVIRSLPIHSGATKRETFRNAAGVAFKLQILRQVATGQGLSNSSKADRSAWADYGKRPDLVRELALRIREQLDTAGPSTDEVATIDEDEEFAEGRVLTAVHSRRERRPEVRHRLIESRSAAGALTCDACGEGPRITDPMLAPSGFEAHHIVPLSTAGVRGTRLRDLALLCATCHRLIHQAMHVRRGWVSVPEFQGLLKSQLTALPSPAEAPQPPHQPVS